MAESVFTSIPFCSANVAKAKQAAVKAQGTVLKAVDKNGNGKIDAEDFGITKESMQDAAQKLKASANRIGESLNDAKTELDRRVLRPVFKEDLYPDSFSGDLLTAVQIPNLICIVGHDKKRTGSAVCVGAIGYWTSVKGAELLNLYEDSAALLGLQFLPSIAETFYYMDPYRSGVYVALDSYFAHAFHLQWKKLRLDAEMLRQIIRYGFPSGVQNSVIGLANVVVQTNINSFGKNTMAAYGTYSKLEGFAFLPITSFAIMPCTAKKMEAGRSEFTHDGQPDVDLVLTTQEFIRMIKEAGIRFNELPDEAPDMPFGLGTGAGVIFGTTSGVAEAVVRRVMESESRNTLQEIAYSGVRGMEGVRAVELPVGEKTIRVGVVHGLKNARQLIAKMEAGEEHFDLVEVMTCTTGCVCGAGQPIGRKEQKYARAKGLYEADRKTLIKSSQRNPILKTLYEKLPPEKAHELLHVHYPQPE